MKTKVVETEVDDSRVLEKFKMKSWRSGLLKTKRFMGKERWRGMVRTWVGMAVEWSAEHKQVGGQLRDWNLNSKWLMIGITVRWTLMQICQLKSMSMPHVLATGQV